MKKLRYGLVVAVYFCTLCSLSSSIFASDVYVGVEGGFQSLTSDMSTNTTNMLGTVGSSSSQAAADGGVGDVYIGIVSQPIPHVMTLGLEANFTGFTAKTDVSYFDISDGSFSANTQWKYNFGVSLIPGYLLTDSTKLYARMGIGYGEYTSSSDNQLTEYINVQDLPGYNGHFSEHDFSYRLGAGVETMITPKWSVRLEYDYWHYNAVDPDDFNDSNGNVISYTFHPSSNTVMLGVSYYFYQSGGADLVL
ncbi:MAG: hypothetical protein CMF55_06390 [Legionellales bacterium]|nr:hypothetical protein [Legionellales bacterium]HAG62345.1 hypothetical protein [Coxiellaceae bacterium]|tara:strand:- start:203 stop:952 length:750 start_codon:yes stop_codon:yes gene_type:complete